MPRRYHVVGKLQGLMCNSVNATDSGTDNESFSEQDCRGRMLYAPQHLGRVRAHPGTACRAHVPANIPLVVTLPYEPTGIVFNNTTDCIMTNPRTSARFLKPSHYARPVRAHRILPPWQTMEDN